jgi:hypothetical protein
VRSLNKRAVQWWPGLCLGVPTGDRSCGKETGFCPCRGVVPGKGETDPTLRGLDPDTVLLIWQGNSKWPVLGRADLNDTVAQVRLVFSSGALHSMCVTRGCGRHVVACVRSETPAA